ncbi:hypothetical protein ACHAQJ_001099 [Trichoderma viride]
MLLINIETSKLENFTDDKVPPYAILSHTWGKESEELHLIDVKDGNINKPGVGSIKFRGCCQQAKSDDLEYVWIDTCCIDKTNQVELGEAINSMFRWYSRAAVCYAYLSDVPDGDNPSTHEFQTSRWFKRGWTLQELLAPKHVKFYNSNWRNIGTKGNRCTAIQGITHVPRQFLLGIAELQNASVAQRMSWVAQRETTRAEDLAYCLLGIFGITMPMIYGEGGKQAFFRLQEQIMKTTRDDSILAWGFNSEIDEPSTSNPSQFIEGEILAAAPSDFANSGHIITREQATNPLHSLDIFGGSLRVYLPLLTASSGETFGLLSCGPESDTRQAVAIPLAKINSAVTNEYVRPRGYPPALRPIATSEASPELIHIKKDGQKNISMKNQQHLFYEEDIFAEVGLTLIDVIPKSFWDEQLSLISSTINSDKSVANQIFIRVRHNKEESQDFVIILDFQQLDSRIDPLCRILICHRKTALEEVAEKFQHMALEAFKQRSATNGSLHLRIILELMDGKLMHMIPEAMTHPPNYTINADMVLDNFDLIVESTQLLKERRQNGTKEDELSRKATDRNKSLKLVKEEQEKTESEIRQLQEKKRMLAEEEIKKVQEMQSLEEERAQVKQSREGISERVLHTQKRLDKLHHTENCKDGWTPFQWAVEDGDVEMMELLLNVAAYVGVAEMDEYMRWLPLAAASSKGDVYKVQQLLSTSGVEPDDKKNRFGRAPLSWASARGHEAIVQLLLDTGKVDVNSQDNHGRTALHWALKGKYRNVVQLLSDNGAYFDCLQTLKGHDGPIPSVALSHDSKLVASGSLDNTIKLWDSTTGQCRQTLQGHNSAIQSVAFSHDSKLVASGSSDNTIKLWDSINGQCQQTLQGHEGYVISVAFSHNSKLVASGSRDKTIKLWDSITGQCQQTLQGHNGSVASVAFSHDSKLVVSGSGDKSIKLWDSMTGQCQQTFQGHDHSIESVAFSHDSKLVASGSRDNTIKLWDSINGQCQQTLQGHDDLIYSVAFSHDSKLVASSSFDKTIKLWDAIAGQCQQTLHSHGDAIYSVVFSYNSKLMASGSWDRTIKLWDTSAWHDLITSS